MAEGFFSEIVNDKNDLNNYEVVCRIKPQYIDEEMPLKQKELYVLVEKTSNIIKNLPEFRDDERHEMRALRKYFRRLKRKGRLEKKYKEYWPEKEDDNQSKNNEQENDDDKNKHAKRKRNHEMSLEKSVSLNKIVQIGVQIDNEEYGKEISAGKAEDDSKKAEKPSNEEDKKKIPTIQGANKAKVRYTNELISNARVGLTGENAQPELAIAAIRTLKEEIMLREGGKVKNRNFCRLGLCSLLMAVITGGVGLVIRLISEGRLFADTAFAETLSKMSLYPYFIVFAGAVIGAWIGFGAETKNYSFNQLAVVHKDRLKSIPRLALFGSSAALLLLFVKSGTIELQLGNITNEVLLQSTGYQILFGAIAGMLGNKVTSGLVERAKDLFDTADENDMTIEEDYSDFFAKRASEEIKKEPSMKVRFVQEKNIVTAVFSEIAFSHSEKEDNIISLDEKSFIVLADKGNPTFKYKYKGNKAVLNIEYNDLNKDDKVNTSVALKEDSAYSLSGKAFPQTNYFFTYVVSEKTEEEK